MDYLKLIDSRRRSNTYGDIQGLVRYNASCYEYYDRRQGQWVEKPELFLDVTGLGGGGHDYRPSTEKEVNTIIDKWNKER